MAVITVIAFSVGAALTAREAADRSASWVVRSAPPFSPAAWSAIASYASGVNAGAGIQREADALAALRSPPAGAGGSRREPPRVRPPLVLGAAHARLAEPHRDHQLPRPGHVRTRDRLARRRAPAPERDGRDRRRDWSAAFVVGFLFALPSPIGWDPDAVEAALARPAGLPRARHAGIRC